MSALEIHFSPGCVEYPSSKYPSSVNHPICEIILPIPPDSLDQIQLRINGEMCIFETIGHRKGYWCKEHYFPLAANFTSVQGADQLYHSILTSYSVSYRVNPQRRIENPIFIFKQGSKTPLLLKGLEHFFIPQKRLVKN